jgi:hypothetical protein
MLQIFGAGESTLQRPHVPGQLHTCTQLGAPFQPTPSAAAAAAAARRVAPASLRLQVEQEQVVCELGIGTALRGRHDLADKEAKQLLLPLRAGDGEKGEG